MGREILVGPVDPRLVAARRRDPSLQIVADKCLRHPAQEGKRIHMGADPIGQRLAEPSLGECVIRRPHDRDEDLGRAHLPGEPVEHRHGIAGEVHEQLFSGRVVLPHGRRDPVAPFDVEVAETAVAVAVVGMVAAIFLPQQRQRYAAAAQVSMDMSQIRKRLRSRRIVPGWRKELALQRRVVDLLRYRPADANHRGATNILRNRRATNPDRPGDHPIARPTGILQAKNFSNLPHRQSLGGHRTSHCVNRKRRTLPRSDCRQRSPSHPINRVAAFVGLGGRFRSESMAAFRRNRWPLCLGFRTFTIVFFLNLFPGRVFGAELACVFAIFTSQAWNMTFSMYQSMRDVPQDLEEASQSFHLGGWQRFWRLDVPFAMPGLIWNTMMSMSGGWFFGVASESITVGDTTVTLPGIGSYVALAIKEQNLPALGYAILAMFLVILAYDQLLFRPVVAWADKFRFEQTAAATAPSSWMLDLFRRTRALRALTTPFVALNKVVSNFHIALPRQLRRAARASGPPSRIVDAVWLATILASTCYAAWKIYAYLSAVLSPSDVFSAIGYGFMTLARVVVLIALASLIWVPVGVWIGLRPKLAERVQPLAQFLAAFPANLAFPVFVVIIVRYGLNPNVWLSPLMILGTQWYILF